MRQKPHHLMSDPEILSVLPDAPALGPTLRPDSALLFDACHLGVVLRAVLFVELVAAVASLFGADSLGDWLIRFSVLTGAVLPGVLVWLLVACSLKTLLARLPLLWQQAIGVALGGLAGLYGCGVLWLAGEQERLPWLASAASGALLAALLVAALVWRARGQAPATTTARLGELQARIRPHFLFNTLNSAIALVRAEPARAEALLENLSDLFRHALREPGPVVTLEQEIALAQRYLAIEQVRFGERLRLSWQLDPQAGAALLPPLLLQPLVENAVRHGVEPSALGAEVCISTERRGERVVIKVKNTLPDGPGAAGQGLALANVQARLKLLHDVQGQCRSGLQDGWFVVRLEVPA
jgi:two-component system sensor histidine kinase AlgZ